MNQIYKLLIGTFSLAAIFVACESDTVSAKDSEIEDPSSSSVIVNSSSTNLSDNSSSSHHCKECNDETISSNESTKSSSSSDNKDNFSSAGTSAVSNSNSSGSGTVSSNNIASSSSSEIESSSSFISGSSPKSSSSVASSSSVTAIDPATVTRGTLIDVRDSQVYKTVTIGTQTWMAENLNYEVTDSYCYKDLQSNCEKYGRLYVWPAAIQQYSCDYKTYDYETYCNNVHNETKGVCPDGWHLPSNIEWNTLFDAVGGVFVAGTMLKSTSGWLKDSNGRDGNGTDVYGFSVLPSGAKLKSDGFNFESGNAYFWTSTEYSYKNAKHVNFNCGHKQAEIYHDQKNYGYSVRCVKDD